MASIRCCCSTSEPNSTDAGSADEAEARFRLGNEAFLKRDYEAALENLPPDTLMDPASIANAYWMLHSQTRDAWTFELDIRPFGETW